MQNQNQNRVRNQHIELAPRLLFNFRPLNPTIRNSRPAHPYSHLPQRNNSSPLRPRLLRRRLQIIQPAPQYSFWSKLRQEKLINLTIILILFLCTIDLGALCGGFYYSLTQTGLKSRETRDSLLKALEFMSADLRADPIMDIQIMSRGETCPSGFKILKLGAWHGTKAGCLCENGDLHGTSCEKVKSEKCERDIPSTLPLELYEWDASIWCLKRAKLGTDYVKKAECPVGLQECYSGGCFAKECPITKIEIASNGGLTLSKAQGELPIINIQMSFGDVPCFTQDFFAQSIENSTYKLSVVKEISCDKYGLDSQFSTRLASQTAYDSLTENYPPSSVMHLPFFEENAAATLSILSSKVRMKTASHNYCLDMDVNSITQFIKEISNKLIYYCDYLLWYFDSYAFLAYF